MSTPSVISHLFTVRLWQEECAAGGREWHGKVQHVLSGETRYFRQWADLIRFLRARSAANSQSVPPRAGAGGEDST